MKLRRALPAAAAPLGTAPMLATLLLAVALIGGCHELAPFGTTDVSGPRSDGSRDGPSTRDAAASDGEPPKSDLAASDRDVIVSDAPTDQSVDGPADSSADTSTDLSPDTGAADTGSEGSTVNPCAAKLRTLLFYSSTMAICGDTSRSPKRTDQCNAAAFCNAAAGWHLCTPSEFLARGGRTQGTGIDAWIAGCIREGDNLFTPTSGVCTSCVAATGGTVLAITYSCQSGPIITATLFRLGVITHAGCRRVGVDTQATEGFWNAERTDRRLPAAVCCL